MKVDSVMLELKYVLEQFVHTDAHLTVFTQLCGQMEALNVPGGDVASRARHACTFCAPPSLPRNPLAH